MEAWRSAVSRRREFAMWSLWRTTWFLEAR